MIQWNGCRLMNVQEVAEILGVTPQHVYSLISQGRLARRVGADGRIRIGEAELEAFFGSAVQAGNVSRSAKAMPRRKQFKQAMEELKKKGL